MLAIKIGVFGFCIPFYYFDTSVLLENTLLIKFIRNYIWDWSGAFSISSLVKISMISLISSLSLKLYLNSLVYDQNIFGSSSKVFSNLWKVLEIFGKSSGMFVWPSENLRESLESGRKSWENCQKCHHQYVFITKRTLHISSKIWLLCSRGKNNVSLVRCAHLVDIVLATRT